MKITRKKTKFPLFASDSYSRVKQRAKQLGLSPTSYTKYILIKDTAPPVWNVLRSKKI